MLIIIGGFNTPFYPPFCCRRTAKMQRARGRAQLCVLLWSNPPRALACDLISLRCANGLRVRPRATVVNLDVLL